MDTHDPAQPRNDVTPANGPAPDNLPDASWLARNGPFLIFFLGLALFLMYKGVTLEWVWNVIKTVLGLGLVIFIHELGHFALAKWCGVKVVTFSLGFGPALPGCSFVWGETLYKIAVLPVGGYVNMLGEGGEGDDNDEDPRSYKNKKVWQRMLIISAGVFMNVVLALFCFVFVYTTRGAEWHPAFIDRVDPGSPLWKTYGELEDGKGWRGVHRGDIIRQLENRTAQPPYPFIWFDHDLQPTVMLSSAGEKMRFVFSSPTAPKAQWVATTIEPRLNAEDGDEKPVIGLALTQDLRLWPKREGKARPSPAVHGSPAAEAKFDFDDDIIGTTDPSTPDKPENVTELAIDPTDPQKKRYDYFDFQRRMHLLAGKKIVIRVRRTDSVDPDDPNATFTTVDVPVEPGYREVLGLRMTMGPITAVRPPASNAGVLPDDVIDAVQVKDGGKVIRWVTNKGPAKDGVEERYLDPDRLPFDLESWAERQPKDSPREVTFTLLRKNPPPQREERSSVEISVKWEDAWRFNAEIPLNLSSPLSLSCLGIAYRIKTTVKGVDPKMPAAEAYVEEPARFPYRDGDRITISVQAGDVVKRGGKEQTLTVGETFALEPGDEVTHGGETFTLVRDSTVSVEKGDQVNLREDDVITETRPYMLEYDMQTKEKNAEEKNERAVKWIKLQDWQWGYIPYGLQGGDSRKIGFRVARGGTLHVSMRAQPDKSWPVSNRGMLLTLDTRLKKAATFGEACLMGLDTTRGFITQIYLSLRSLATGRVSINNFVGPIGISTAAFNLAGQNIYQFILFLGIISVNLAVVNFLPIPVLDGGHMVFLVWEAVRGKPASIRIRELATYLGLAFIVCLMLFVIYLDVSREIQRH